MIRKSSIDHYQSQDDKNERLLGESEMGALLLSAYHTAIGLDPRLTEVNIIPLEDDSKRVAYAEPSWSPDAKDGKNEVHIRLSDLDGALARHQAVLDKVPGYRELFAKKIFDMDPADITPQLMHVFSILHEMGHALEYMDNANDPSALEERKKREKEGLPIGRATVSMLLDETSYARSFVKDNWSKVVHHTGATSMDDLVEKQHVAYRETTSERRADNFALDVLDANPQLIDQLASPKLDYYRNFKAA